MFFRKLVVFAALAMAPAQALAAWHEAKTRHFIIYSEQKPDELRDYAAKLERFDSAVRAARKMSDPPLTDSQRLTVYVLPTQAAIETLIGAPNSGVAGFYIGRASGAVAFVNTEKGATSWDLDAQKIFFHEYLHHLMLQDLSVAYPDWMVEGYAEFFATARFGDDGSVEFGHAAHHRGYGLRVYDGLSLARMLGQTYTKLTAEEWSSIYGRGWLLTHYLAFEPSRRGQVTRYVQGIQNGQTMLDSAKAAFGDLKKLDRELDAYLNRDTLPTQIIPASLVSVGPIAVRRLPRAEDAIAGVRLRVDSAVDKGAARFVAGDARRVGERFPTDPVVQTTVARAELDAKRYAAAIEAADRALAADPKAMKAMIARGRAMMALARDDPARADWKAVRSWFARANNLDPDAAEPLMLYFRTFREEGSTPTPTAVEGLLYALEIAPQDSDLRLMAVRQLLADRKLAEARRTFAPIAYSYHSARQRERNLEIMDKIAAGDAAGAIAMLDEDEKERRKKE